VLTTRLNSLLTCQYKSRHVLVALCSALCSTTSTGRTGGGAKKRIEKKT